MAIMPPIYGQSRDELNDSALDFIIDIMALHGDRPSYETEDMRVQTVEADGVTFVLVGPKATTLVCPVDGPDGLSDDEIERAAQRALASHTAFLVDLDTSALS